MSQPKAPHPRDNARRSETPPIPLICSNCRTCIGVRYLCIYCVGFPPVAVCQQCKEAPLYFDHMWHCSEGRPNTMPRAEVPPADGTSSTPNVSSNAIDTSREAPPSAILGSTLSSQAEEGYATPRNVGSTKMRTSASKGRLDTFRNMKVGKVVRDTVASPEIALYYPTRTHVASPVVKNTGCNREVQQLNARWKSKNEDPHYISGEWILGNDNIHIVVAKKVTRFNGICICYCPGTNRSLMKCEWRYAEVYPWECDWMPFIYQSVLGEWVEYDESSFPLLNDMGFVACETLDGEDKIRAPLTVDHHFLCFPYSGERDNERFSYDHLHCNECRNCRQGDPQHSSIITGYVFTCISSSTESSRRQSQGNPINTPINHSLYDIGYYTYLDPQYKSSSAACCCTSEPTGAGSGDFRGDRSM